MDDEVEQSFEDWVEANDAVEDLGDERYCVTLKRPRNLGEEKRTTVTLRVPNMADLARHQGQKNKAKQAAQMMADLAEMPLDFIMSLSVRDSTVLAKIVGEG